MGTTADKLNRLIGTKQAIREAIEAKGVEVAETDTFRSYADKIGEIQSGRLTPAAPDDVNFRDYDGTILHSYSKEEFLLLDSMPELPEQDGLVCKGWTWTLEEAIDYVNKYGSLEIGASYDTDETDGGDIRLYITILDITRPYVSVYFEQRIAYSTVVDWGDGATSETEVKTGSIGISHKYERPGDYVIRLSTTGQIRIGTSSSSTGLLGRVDETTSSRYTGTPCMNMLRKLEIGAYSPIWSYALRWCHSLKSVVLSWDLYGYLDGSIFYGCRSLDYIVIPRDLTGLGNNIFGDCSSLRSISLSPKITNIYDKAFYNCVSLSKITLPPELSSIGNSAFINCSSLSSIVIPEGVTTIGNNAFELCTGLEKVDCSHLIAVPTLGSKAFNTIRSACKIIVPDALYDEWIAATNWSTYASQIVKVSEYNG